MKKKISILGCGHLGKALIKRLELKDFLIKASTKSSAFNLDDIEHVFLDIEKVQSQQWFSFLQTDCLIIALPPSSSKLYPQLAQIISPYIENPLMQIILISSIGVYANDQGEVDENTRPRGKEALVQIETHFHEKLPQTTILRLGGIVSPTRQVWNYLEGRTLEFDEYLHLVDIENCLDAIVIVINESEKYRGEIYNIVNSQRELKSIFYTRKCKTPPYFLQMRRCAKNISNKKSLEDLDIKYRVI